MKSQEIPWLLVCWWPSGRKYTMRTLPTVAKSQPLWCFTVKRGEEEEEDGHEEPVFPPTSVLLGIVPPLPTPPTTPDPGRFLAPACRSSPERETGEQTKQPWKEFRPRRPRPGPPSPPLLHRQRGRIPSPYSLNPPKQPAPKRENEREGAPSPEPRGSQLPQCL